MKKVFLFCVFPCFTSTVVAVLHPSDLRHGRSQMRKVALLQSTGEINVKSMPFEQGIVSPVGTYHIPPEIHVESSPLVVNNASVIEAHHHLPEVHLQSSPSVLGNASLLAAHRITHRTITASTATATTIGKVCIGIVLSCWVVFLGTTLWAGISFWMRFGVGKSEQPIETPNEDLLDERFSTAGLLCLTSYRFYSGFLTGTWVPYVLALEGEYLWGSHQSLYIAIAKLIYAGTILCNPLAGLVGDQLVQYSHGQGRRLYILCGVSFAGIGCFVCIIANSIGSLWLSFLGIFFWRMGEAINDVTTEAIVPEMVPASQYQVGAALKAALFLFGGLTGYVLLLIFSDASFTWFYWAYMVGMLVACVPPLCMLNRDRLPRQREFEGWQTFGQGLLRAYWGPLTYQGGFPLACWAVFCFGLGVSPLFFMLLIIRDIVGISSGTAQDETFAVVAIVFFLSAGCSSVLGALDRRASCSFDRLRFYRGKILNVTNLTCGVCALLIPCFILLPTLKSRLVALYLGCVLYGGCFGSSFSRFQDTSWELLPANADWSTAMGFNVMLRNVGVGVGNVVAGVVLDRFPMEDGSVGYKPAGYFIMGIMCFCGILAATWLGWQSILVGADEEEKEEQKMPDAQEQTANANPLEN